MNDTHKTVPELPAPSLSHKAEDEPLHLRVDLLNQAAEDYFARQKNSDYMLRKPFTVAREMSEFLYRFSILVAGLDLNVTDLVMDFGAGTCWVSLLLSRAGIHTVAVDVSTTALEMGRRIFESTPQTQRGVPPQFVVYDGHRLPFEDGLFDAIVCLDAFHHVPNKEAMLAEMFRVLAPGGRAAFSEPGEGHSSHIIAQREAREYGVLESDVLLADVEAWARRAGLERFTLWPFPSLRSVEMAWPDVQRFLMGQNDAFPIGHFHHAVKVSPFFCVYKGRTEPDSRHFRTLRADIHYHGNDLLRVQANSLLKLSCTVTNLGDTRWLAGPLERGGYVRLGAHLLDGRQHVQDRDYGRARLPRDLPPGQSEALLLTLRAPEQAGIYAVEFDMVSERVTWFAEQGSPTVQIKLEVF